VRQRQNGTRKAKPVTYIPHGNSNETVCKQKVIQRLQLETRERWDFRIS